MLTTKTKFPIYRKYTGISVWFKIENDKNFIEVRQIGSKFVKHIVVAEQYPEMVLIKDMIACFEGRWEKSDAVSFATAFNQIKK